MLSSLKSSLTILLTIFLTIATTLAQTIPSFNATLPPLNVTAISARDNISILECWQLATLPSIFAGAINFPLGAVEKASWAVIPPRTMVGLHNAPYVQLVFALAGTVHIKTNQTIPRTSPSYSSTVWSSLPSSPNDTFAVPEAEAWMHGGRNGFFIAADTSNVSAVGHVAEFPSDAATVLVQVPLEGNRVPEHTVLYEGVCAEGDLLGY
ncbi:hypothetical protein K402DRAFT_396455 [Aulographum hederae CBS 113979]|uniref:Uncharacterized protein n=1 Tax=Aulographum hederae CBS 113979 TaxID=1176131 RepID=A0A6G1GSI1_9PEZI|nr:hypothetical protein K402DRAFT_396455 [Aulographum hederae CBS 113979]